MSRGYLQGYSDYEYREVRKQGQRASKAAQSYRQKYLDLRKDLRDHIRSNDIDLPEHLRKAIGMK
jgi:hypothetical protein